MKLAARLTRLERLPRRPGTYAPVALPPALGVAIDRYCADRWAVRPWPLGFESFNLHDPTTEARLAGAVAELLQLPDKTTEAEYGRALSDLLGEP